MWRRRQAEEQFEERHGTMLSPDEVAHELARHAEAARHVAMALIGPSDAEDAVQEALLRGWQAWATLRDPAAVRPWLLRITVNVCRDWRRGRYGTHRRLNGPLEDIDLRPLAYIATPPGASIHTALDLRNAVNRLDEPQRIVVVLRYYGGLDASEIGEILTIPPSTVRTRLSRALERLRASLADSGEQPIPTRQEDAGV